ncbi:MAG: molybdopterin-dependent oxidoreductase [Thiotrichales bacterium]
MNTPIKTTCPYCGVGCGILATPTPEGVKIQGDPDHPANYGRLCSKGAALGETLDLDGRLLYPEINGKRASWEKALATVANRFQQVIAEHGPDAVAFYVSGQLLTEDYYVANKLMKGFIGGGNIDTNSRLCMSSAVAGHKRAFGADTVPGCYEDLELADLVVLVGSNMAWTHPVLFQRLSAAKQARPEMRVVVIDPRRTATCDLADTHLSLKPGSDAFLFNGLLNHLRREDALDWRFLEGQTEGFGLAFDAAREASIPWVAASCGLTETQVVEFYRLFTRTEKTVTVFSQGINQSSSAVDKVNAIINVHLATGRIGKPGACPFSVTGQPNAMGGREVGGLANQLAAHRDFDPDSIARVAEFWYAPRMAERPGLKAVDLFEAVHAGRIKALWIIATNPVVSLPEADRVKAALETCEFLVVSDCVRHTDTTIHADVLLPAAAWGEKNGSVTNSERRISRQRAFLAPPGEAMPDWWIVAKIARLMGYASSFDYAGPADIFREHAALSARVNAGRHDFDLSGLTTLSDAEYAQFAPTQWPINVDFPYGRARFFDDGRFHTASGKASFIAVEPRCPTHAPDTTHPLVLNTGRVRDQWHSMTRTGKTARLLSHIAEPFAEIHPRDAARVALRDGMLARVMNQNGDIIVRVRVSDAQQEGSIFVPMHWNSLFASRARVGALVNAVVDPISGQPESKHTPVRIEAYTARWHGFILSRDALALPDCEYAARIPGRGYWRYELAGAATFDWPRALHETLHSLDLQWLEFQDPGTRRYRGAAIRGERLQLVAFFSALPDLPPRGWLGEIFTDATLSDTARRAVLAGGPGAGQADRGRTICACFNVGLNTLQIAIREQGLTSVEAIGRALQAGTHCGSCRPELKALIDTNSID